MDACLRKFETSTGFVLATPTSSEEVTVSMPRRIANWDNKREKCNNCEHIYLKTLSQHPGFCSVDCKSNMAYLEKVNRTIRAVKNAVDGRQYKQKQASIEEPMAQKESQQVQVDQQSKPQPSRASPKDGAETGVVHSFKYAQSFAEFDLDSRVLDASNVEWSFSAMY